MHVFVVVLADIAHCEMLVTVTEATRDDEDPFAAWVIVPGKLGVSLCLEQVHPFTKTSRAL
jgi:hypothetical protein